MSTALSNYELEKLIEIREWDLAERLKRRLLMSARRWVIEQSMSAEPGTELSRHSGGRV
jgi:hypothetical protein